MVTARQTTPERFRRGAAAPYPPEEAPDPPTVGARANPTFGPEYWPLGLAAASPALLAALLLILCAGGLPLLPALPAGPILIALLALLGAGALAAHRFGYPAWSHPGIALIPTLALLVPAAMLRGQLIVRVNGDPDPMAILPLGIAWLLILAATITIVMVAVTLGRYAPSFSGLALLPAPLILAWLFVIPAPFAARQALAALGSALALAALATFAAWVAPARQRPLVPVLALAAQLGLFWLRRFGWPNFSGLTRPIAALDIALYLVLVGLVLTTPVLAAWMRRSGWPALRRLFS
jgi:hypothetical protein